MSNKNWSEYQKAVFSWVEEGTGSAVVEAVAGSGKTTTLVEAVKRMQGDVALMAYNKKMGDELKTRVVGLDHVNAATCHAFGFKAFRNSGVKAQLDDKKVWNIATSIIPQDYLGFIQPFVCKLVGFAKDNGIGFLSAISDLANWQAIIDHHDLSIENGNVDYDTAINYAIKVLTASNQNRNVIDFGDMIYLPLFLGLKIDQYDWVLVDEAQDTNPTRRALAKAMLKPSGRLIAVGDPAQAIFGFTGANHDSLELIRRDFAAVTMPLSVCYRCGSKIIAHAKTWNPRIEAFEGNAEGEIQNVEYAEFLKNVLTYGLSGKDGIICRKNAPLMGLAFALIRQGIPCRIEGKDIAAGLKRLASKWKVQSLNKLIERVSDFSSREQQKAIAKGEDMKAEQIADKCEALLCLIERCQALGKHTVKDLTSLIDSMFSDSGSYGANPNIVTLSSVHKSKGLEWDRVFLLGREEFMPSPYARQAWQQEQERNLIYVAITRAKSLLIEVSGMTA